MYIRIATFAALAFVVSAQGVLAGEVRRLKVDKGIAVTHQPRLDRYCIRLTSAREAERLALRVYRPECKTAAKWAVEGVTLWRGGVRIKDAATRANPRS